MSKYIFYKQKFSKHSRYDGIRKLKENELFDQLLKDNIARDEIPNIIIKLKSNKIFETKYAIYGLWQENF